MKNKKLKLIGIVFITLILGLWSVNNIGYDNEIYLKSNSNKVAKNADSGAKITEDTKRIVKKIEGSNDPLTKKELKQVETKLASTPIIYSTDYDVYMPIYTSNPNDTKEQKAELDKGAISYQAYGTPGKGNYDVFAHNAFEEGQYFTSFAKHLKKGDKVYVLAKDGNEYKKYEYTIKYEFIADKDDVNTVYYDSDEPMISIGTCKLPYKTENRIVWQGYLTNTTEIK